MKSMLENGLLTKEAARERQWVGVVLVRKTVIAFIEDAITLRVRSWDTVISKILTLIVLSALGARAGDATRSNGRS